MSNYNLTNESINNTIINVLDNIMYTLKSIEIKIDKSKIPIVILPELIKKELKKIKFRLTKDGKVRNIVSYIKREYKSLSNFIKTQTNYKIVLENDNLYIKK